jgi:hypothetical protein
MIIFSKHLLILEAYLLARTGKQLNANQLIIRPTGFKVERFNRTVRYEWLSQY